eukprot:TRINITY_DN18668_c0_g1_i1.p1 TRINITY_DN18668_c0_g1~~TRINITY_DN18668_c0_g1_i1.p1  ORF type:complete len:267 (-),score=12.22 TRINITY_DN18668_c0_g1_i1:117-875(-)
MTSDPLQHNLESKIRFLEEEKIDREFVCSICHQFFREPFRSVECGHTFCKSCIQNWAAINPICPLDKQQLKTMTFDRAVHNMMENFRVECGQCLEWKGKKSDIRDHLASEHSLIFPTISHDNFEFSTNNNTEMRIELPNYTANSNLQRTQYPSTMPEPPSTLFVRLESEPISCSRHGEVAATFRCLICLRDYCGCQGSGPVCRECTALNTGLYGGLCYSPECLCFRICGGVCMVIIALVTFLFIYLYLEAQT